MPDKATLPGLHDCIGKASRGRWTTDRHEIGIRSEMGILRRTTEKPTRDAIRPMDWENAFFGGWPALARTAAVGVGAYASLIVGLRISGKRTLAAMNAFDLVVTVALGSTLSSVLVNSRVSLAQGALALGLLIALQFAITWTSVRIRWARRLVTGEPTLLAHLGQPLSAALRRARVTEDEILAAARSAGHASLASTTAVVLETDGSFSVVPSRIAG